MNGIDGFLGKSSITFDARVMSTEGKPGGAGTQAESGMAGTFDGHLAGLSRQDVLASDLADLKSLPSPALPGRVQQRFLVAPGAAEPAVPDASEQEEEMPETLSATANPRANGNGLDSVEVTGQPAIALARMTVLAGPNEDGPGRELRENHLTKNALTVDHDDSELNPSKITTVIDAESFTPDAGQDMAVAFADKHSQSDPPPAAPVNASPLVPGLLAPLIMALASRAKDNITIGPVVSAGAPAAGVIPEATGDSVSLMGPGGSRAAGRPPLGLVSQENSAPYASLTVDPNGGADLAVPAPGAVMVAGQQTHLAPPGTLSSSQQMAVHPFLVSTPVRTARDTHGLPVASAPVQLFSDSTPGRAGSQDSVQLSVAHSDDAFSLDAMASAPRKDRVVNHTAHLAPLDRSSPIQQVAQSITAAAGTDKQDTRGTRAQSSGVLNRADLADSQLFSRVQILQVQLEPESLGKVTVRMRLSGTRLDLRVEAEHPGTMQLLGNEKDLLTNKLKAAGYAMESLVIQPAEPKASHQPLGLNTPSGGQDQSTGQANGGPSHDRSSTQNDRERSRPLLADDTPDGIGVRPASGELYL